MTLALSERTGRRDPQRLDQQENERARAAYRPSAADLRDIRTVKERLDLAERGKLPYVENWTLNLAYYRGGDAQWGTYEPVTRAFLTGTPGVDFEDWEERLVDNQIPQMLIQWAAKQNKNRSITLCPPNDPQNEEDVAVSDAATKVLRHLDRTTDRNRKRRRAELLRALYGTCFLSPYWDRDRRTTVAIQDPTTGAVRGKEAWIGDVDWEVLSVWDVAPEPVLEWEHVTWCVKSRLRTLAWIREEFPKYGALVLSEQDEGETLNSGLTRWGVVGTGNRQVREPSARVLEYYEKPSRRHPKGRWLIVAGDILLYREDALPHPKGEFPIIRVMGLPAIEGLWGKSLVEDLRGQQDFLNRIESRVMENFDLTGDPKVLLPMEAKVGEEQFNNQSGEVVEYKATAAGGAKPEWMQPPQLPVYVRELPAEVKASMGQIAGLNEVTSQSAAPSGVHAATAIALLQEQDETRFAFAADEMADALTELDRQMLGFVQAYWTVPRAVKVLGDEKGPGAVLALMGSDLKGATEVSLDSTPGVNDSLATKRQRYMDYVQAGIIALNGDPATAAGLLRVMDEKELAEVVTAQAQRAEQMRQQAMAQQQEALQAQAAMQQGQVQGQQQQQELQAQGTAQQQAQQAAAAEQQRAHADASHAQQLQHTQEKHTQGLSAALQMQAVKMAAAKAAQAQRATGGPS